MSPSFRSWVGFGFRNRLQESLLCVAAGLTPGPLFLCPLARRIVPYSRADVTIGNLRIDPHAFRWCLKQPCATSKYPRKRACDQVHTPACGCELYGDSRYVPAAVKAPLRRTVRVAHRRGAKASSLNSNDPWMPGPAATTAAAPGGMWFKPLTTAPASVAISQPAARSHGFSPDS
jgi:hypothetical protein